MEERVLAAGEAIECLCYEDAMRWCQRGWQAWRPCWASGWFLFVRGGDICTHTPDGAVVGTGSADDQAAKDWIVRVFRHRDVRPIDQPSTHSGYARITDTIEPMTYEEMAKAIQVGSMNGKIARDPVPTRLTVLLDNPDAEIRLQIAVREVVSRSIEDGLSASGAFRVLDHELARIGEMVESAAAG